MYVSPVLAPARLARGSDRVSVAPQTASTSEQLSLQFLDMVRGANMGNRFKTVASPP